MELHHEPANHRFVAVLDDGEAVLEYQPLGAGIVDFNHTYVPRQFRGRGVAGQLVPFALDEARSTGLKVVPSCPFVAKFIARNSAYHDLRAEAPS